MDAHLGEHRTLVKQVWPDKLLFGTILLFATGLVGVLHALVDLVVGVDYATTLPEILQGWPAWQVGGLSVASAALAVAALRTRTVGWAYLGVLAGVLSMGMLGLGPLLALVAWGFLIAARMEGEDVSPGTAALTSGMWPDKALAASMVLLLGAAVSLAWGIGLASGGVALGELDLPLLGPAALLVGALSLGAAYQLYRQRMPWLGVLAALGLVATLGMVIVGPLVGVVALVLIALAWREDEFASREAFAEARA